MTKSDSSACAYVLQDKGECGAAAPIITSPIGWKKIEIKPQRDGPIALVLVKICECIDKFGNPKCAFCNEWTGASDEVCECKESLALMTSLGEHPDICGECVCIRRNNLV